MVIIFTVKQTESQKVVAAEVVVSGRVQGVCYRAFTQEAALDLGLGGWVRNLPDGRVELQVGGAESEVFAFLDSVMESELRSHIDKQTRAALPEPVRARGFEIRHD